MSDTEPDWSHYKSFLSVLEHGSLSGAARALGLTQPTLGRHIDDLQQRLGIPLFTRSQTGLVPTDAAIALRPHAEALKAAADAIARAATGIGDGVRGAVRITASEVIGVEVLPPILAALRQRYPDLTIELMLSNRVENLLRRDADIAIRMVEPEQDALIARHIGAVNLGLHAHKTYLEKAGAPKTWKDLRAHTLIGYDTETPAIRSMMTRAPELRRDLFAIKTDSDIAQLAMIRAGIGVGICQVGLAQRDSSIARVLPDFTLALDTWVTMHEDLRDSLRCRVTFDALVEGLQRYVGEAKPGVKKSPSKR